jgi:SET domain-containing protein
LHNLSEMIVNGDLKMGFYATRDIEAGEELFLWYGEELFRQMTEGTTELENTQDTDTERSYTLQPVLELSSDTMSYE